MQFNFFDWVRDGVRSAVLMGVSDAVDQLGAPSESQEFNEDLAGYLNAKPEGGTATKRVTAKTSGGTTTAAKKKRLGRSLKEIEGDK